MKKIFFSPSVFLYPLFTVYKKVTEFSYTQQKIFWVLVFSIRIWYLAYPTDRSFILKKFEKVRFSSQFHYFEENSCKSSSIGFRTLRDGSYLLLTPQHPKPFRKSPNSERRLVIRKYGLNILASTSKAVSSKNPNVDFYQR